MAMPRLLARLPVFRQRGALERREIASMSTGRPSCGPPHRGDARGLSTSKEGLMTRMSLAIARGFAAVNVCLTVAMAPAARADVITDWNQTAMAVMKAASIGGNPWARNMAMMHVAMSDAVNSVQNKYALFAPAGAPAPGASAEVAAAAAARSVLLQQVPGQKAQIERAFEVSTKDIPDGTAKKEGISVGEGCAAAIIADRASDGTSVPDTYRPITTPGAW